MSAAIVRAQDARVTVTPNATMTTLSSPSQSGSAHSLWRTEMAPGQQGPLHSFDVEQIWTVLAGSARMVIDGVAHTLSEGDTVYIEAEAERQVSTDVGAVFHVCSDGAARATPDVGEPVAPAWIV